MKKLLKILMILAVSGVVLLTAAYAAFRWMFPDEKLKQMALDYAKNKWHREISFDRLSLNVIGVKLDNFALSEATTFEQGTFIKAQQLQAKIAFWPLLRKRVEISTIRINGLEVNIVKNADGTFNFDNFVTEETKPEETVPQEDSSSGLGFSLTAKHFIANDCRFSYKDNAAGTTLGVSKINFDIENFDLDDPFTTLITFTTSFKQKNGATVAVPTKIDLTLFLANLDMSQAYVTLNQATASYKTVNLALKGKVESFTNPSATLTGTISGVNNLIFTDFLPDLPNFTLPTINLALTAESNLEEGTALLKQAAIQLLDSTISVSGPISWGGKTSTYSLAGNVNIDLDQAVQMTDTVDIRPTGTFSGSFKATEKKDFQDIAGTFQLKNISLIYDPFTLTKLNGTIKMASVKDISSNNLVGLLNGEKITANFSYKQLASVPNIVFNADLAKLHLDRFTNSTETQAAATEETTETEQTPSSGPETVFNLKTDLKIGEIQIPYFRSNGFNLQADLTGLSASMKQTNGQLSFTLQPGAVTDMDTFIKGNKIVRILMLPISIINSVAKKLNISLFEATSSARKGEIAFTSGEGEYTFTNGLMTINNTTFISDLTNIKGTGNINFPTSALDMKVSATVLSKQTPMVIKIGGTLDNPSGKLDVLNTVGSVVGGLLNYKTATGLATGTVKTAGNVATGAAKTAGHVATGAAKTAGHVATGAVKTTGQAVGTVAKTGATAAKGTAHAAKTTVKAIGSLFTKNKDKTESDSEEEAAK